MSNFIDISLEDREFQAMLRSVEKMHDSITPQWMKTTQRRKLQPMVQDMKVRSKSSRIAEMISVTTAKKRAGEFGAKVGVVKNDTSLFPKFSAQALASVIEYGTDERFRTLKAGVLVTGRQSTGSVKPYPFLRPAWDANKESFMKATEEAILNKVERDGRT